MNPPVLIVFLRLPVVLTRRRRRLTFLTALLSKIKNQWVVLKKMAVFVLLLLISGTLLKKIVILLMILIIKLLFDRTPQIGLSVLMLVLRWGSGRLKPRNLLIKWQSNIVVELVSLRLMKRLKTWRSGIVYLLFVKAVRVALIMVFKLLRGFCFLFRPLMTLNQRRTIIVVMQNVNPVKILAPKAFLLVPLGGVRLRVTQNVIILIG